MPQIISLKLLIITIGLLKHTELYSIFIPTKIILRTIFVC